MPATTRAMPQDARPRTSLPFGPGGEPSEETIRLRAYEIYLARGAQPGRDAEDWEQAKRELLRTR